MGLEYCQPVMHHEVQCMHSVFVCFVQISEQTATVSQYSFGRLCFITETECLLRGTAKGMKSYSGRGRAMAQGVGRRPVTAETRIWSQVIPCEICGTGFFPPSISVFHSQYHSTNTPYSHSSEQGKTGEA
jgi:hypothetical protein